jgi:hypothetical protein
MLWPAVQPCYGQHSNHAMASTPTMLWSAVRPYYAPWVLPARPAARGRRGTSRATRAHEAGVAAGMDGRMQREWVGVGAWLRG